MNPAGAALLGGTVDQLVGRVIWEEFPEAVDSPFERHYREVAGDRGAGQLRGLVRAAADLVPGRRLPHRRRRWSSPTTTSPLAARGGAGPGRGDPAREEAVDRRPPRREEAELAGRHLMLLGDINLAMTSTLDTDEAVQRFAELVVPLLADWCLVSVVDPDGTPPRRRPGAPRPGAGRGDAPLRRPAGGDQPGRRAGADRCSGSAGRWSSRDLTAEVAGHDDHAEARAALAAAAARPPSPPSR